MEIQTWISDTTSPNKIRSGFYFILVRQIKYCCHGKFLFLVGWIFKKFANDLNYIQMLFVRIMVFNATFNNISVISWRTVLLVEETGVPRENHRPESYFNVMLRVSQFFFLLDKTNSQKTNRNHLQSFFKKSVMKVIWC